jgi:hypothetical protein
MPRHNAEATTMSAPGAAFRFVPAVLLGALALLNVASLLASLLAHG